MKSRLKFGAILWTYRARLLVGDQRHLVGIVAAVMLSVSTGLEADNGAEVYEDRYLADDEDFVDEPSETPSDAGDGPPTVFGAALRTYLDAREATAPLTELGIDFSWRRETPLHGDVDIEFEQLRSRGLAERKSGVSRLWIRQRDFVLTDQWSLNSDLGHFRSQNESLLAQSYRFFLPTTLLQGGSSEIHSRTGSLRLTAGHIGTLEGVAARGFRRSQGTMVGLNGRYLISDRLTLAGQIWDINGGGRQRFEHQVAGGALGYISASGDQQHQWRTLRDSKGNSGGWYDAQSLWGRWRHRYGAFHFEPDLRWTDLQIENDRQGGYWRGDFSSFRWRWTLGTELSRNNLEERRNQPGNVITNSFINGSWRYRRATQLGALLSVATQHADSGTARGEGHTAEARTFLTHDFSFGLSRFELRVRNENLPANELASAELRWNHEWNPPILDRLTSQLELEQNTDEERDIRLGFVANRDFANNHSVGVDFQINHRRDASGSETLAFNWGFGYDWLVHRDLTLALTGTAGRVQTNPIFGPGETTDNMTILFTVNYLNNSGRPLRPVGNATGSRGAGTIRGRVFLDADRDGSYSGSEQAVARITVYLDGRFPTETTTAGEYEFRNVPTGEHFIQLAVDEAPLPWGLDDEGPRRVLVTVRGTEQINIGLTEIE